MVVMNKQECGTLAAFRWHNGIAFGIYGKGNFASFEYDSDTKALVLLINDAVLEEQNVVIKHVSETKGWY